MQDPTLPLIASESKNNGKTIRTPVAGFNTRPENINKNGRPKKDWTWKQLLEEAAEELIETKAKDKDGKTVITGRKALKQLVARKLLTQAAGGNVNAARELMNRMDGMPQQKVDVEANGNWNVTLKREETKDDTKA